MINNHLSRALSIIASFLVIIGVGAEKLAASIEGRAPSPEESRELQRLSNRVIFIGHSALHLKKPTPY